MPSSPPQNFDNHVRTDRPMMAAFIAVAAAFILAATALVRRPGLETAALALLSIATLVIAWKARVYGVTVQDRVIRLEMRLRLAKVLAGDLVERADALTVKQLVALRFASDAELPALVRRVLDEDITKARDIKRLVKDWQADHLRV